MDQGKINSALAAATVAAYAKDRRVIAHNTWDALVGEMPEDEVGAASVLLRWHAREHGYDAAVIVAALGLTGYVPPPDRSFAGGAFVRAEYTGVSARKFYGVVVSAEWDDDESGDGDWVYQIDNGVSLVSVPERYITFA